MITPIPSSSQQLAILVLLLVVFTVHCHFIELHDQAELRKRLLLSESRQRSASNRKPRDRLKWQTFKENISDTQFR